MLVFPKIICNLKLKYNLLFFLFQNKPDEIILNIILQLLLANDIGFPLNEIYLKEKQYVSMIHTDYTDITISFCLRLTVFHTLINVFLCK